MSTWHGSSRTPNRDQWPYAGIWQEAPELSASPEGSDQQGVQMAAEVAARAGSSKPFKVIYDGASARVEMI